MLRVVCHFPFAHLVFVPCVLLCFLLTLVSLISVLSRLYAEAQALLLVIIFAGVPVQAMGVTARTCRVCTAHQANGFPTCARICVQFVQ